MPFDATPQEVTLEPFSVEDIAAWLETQPPEKAYCYSNVKECLLAQYTLARGGRIFYPHEPDEFGGGHYILGDKHISTLPIWNRKLKHIVAGPRGVGLRGAAGWTFGRALLRARSFLSGK